MVYQQKCNHPIILNIQIAVRHEASSKLKVRKKKYVTEYDIGNEDIQKYFRFVHLKKFIVQKNIICKESHVYSSSKICCLTKMCSKF